MATSGIYCNASKAKADTVCLHVHKPLRGRFAQYIPVPICTLDRVYMVRRKAAYWIVHASNFNS